MEQRFNGEVTTKSKAALAALINSGKLTSTNPRLSGPDSRLSPSDSTIIEESGEDTPAPAPAIPGMTGPPGRDYSTAKYSDDPVDYPSDYDYGGWY